MATKIIYNELARELKSKLDCKDFYTYIILPVYEFNGKTVRCELTIDGTTREGGNDHLCDNDENKHSFYTRVDLIICNEGYKFCWDDPLIIKRFNTIKIHNKDEYGTVEDIELLIKTVVILLDEYKHNLATLLD